MHTWKTHLDGVLRRLAESHGDRTLPEVERALMSILDAHSVRFHRADGTRIPRGTLLSEILQNGYMVEIRVTGQVGAADSSTMSETVPSRFLPGELPPSDASPDARCDAFIREFARLEQRHEFMWAGYIVRELLPRFGFPADETKVVLDRLCADGVLAMSKVPNPRNPNFPATGVRLNHEHERVKNLLDGNRGGPSDPPSVPPGSPAEG